MSNGKVDTNMVSNGLEILNNLSKVTANVTSPRTPERKTYREGDKLDQPHNQTVEVKVGNPDQPAQKPMVVHEKKETHIHKPFPEGRELSERECEVEKLRLQLEYDAKKDDLAYRCQMEEARRKERREKDEIERKERERRYEESRKSSRRFYVFAGAALAGVLGLAAYGIYSDSRRSNCSRLPVQQQPGIANPTAIEAEGTVK